MTTRTTLHFLTCGHVDDGKSTLMGRLLYDMEAVPDDQVKGAMVDGVIDYSRLTDGLDDERSQGITIDVAYRYFRFNGRHYRIADTPGHIQYIRNMAVAAANSDCALILVDAAHGVREQTIRHSRISAFFGIKDFVIVINKMDLVNYSEDRFRAIEADYKKAFGPAPDMRITFIPVSAISGDNITKKSARTSWYKGPALLDHLEGLHVPAQAEHGFRLPIQYVSRLNDVTRGYLGMVVGGRVKVGDRLAIAGSPQTIPVTALYHSGKAVNDAGAGAAITLVTHDDADLSRGNVLCAQSHIVPVVDGFAAKLLWIDPAMAERDAVQGIIKIHNREEQAEVRVIKKDDPITHVNVFAANPLPVDLYIHARTMGLFLLIDPENDKVLGVGTVTALKPEEEPPAKMASSFF